MSERAKGKNHPRSLEARRRERDDRERGKCNRQMRWAEGKARAAKQVAK
jgi:hypothetical protein